MDLPAKINKLDEVVVNRIAAGEIIQRPCNALKELIENSLDAKATNIQIIVKEGGLKMLQIQDNGTGIRKSDMDIVCERFTTSKLQKFDDLKSISTFGFRGEALASMSHIALLTITTKTADEKCAYKASYVDSKLKAPPKPCAGNQGTTILIENLFYNVPIRRKALSNPAEEFKRILEVVMKYAIHNSKVGFTLKKHGESTVQVRTIHNSTKMNNIRAIYSNTIARELLEIELEDKDYKFKMYSLITNPNYAGKKLELLLFINNRLVDSSSIRKMLADLYTVYIPKKAYPWCYISLDIEPNNIDVNIHPTKHEVRFLHEDIIIEKMKNALDGKLLNNKESRTFYVQARLPTADITKNVLKEVLPEYDTDKIEKGKNLYPKEMVRANKDDQKLDKFNFTINSTTKSSITDYNEEMQEENISTEKFDSEIISTVVSNEKNISVTNQESTSENPVIKIPDVKNMKNPKENSILHSFENKVCEINFSDMIDEITQPNLNDVTSQQQTNEIEKPIFENSKMDDESDRFSFTTEMSVENTDETISNTMDVDMVANNARQQVYKFFGTPDEFCKDKKNDTNKNPSTAKINEESEHSSEENVSNENIQNSPPSSNMSNLQKEKDNNLSKTEFKSYSINSFRREVKLTSILRLRKDVEDKCHTGLKEILSNLVFIGCINKKFALIQSGINLYICNTQKLAEELFYEIMVYDFANFGSIKFSDPLPLHDLAMLALDTEEAGWTEEEGSKTELATRTMELLLEKADMMKEYFSIVIDKKGNLKSLPVILEKYFPDEGELPLFILRLATEVHWTTEQPCFQDICRETAKYFSQLNTVHNENDWKYVTEHILYPAIKESLLPPNHFAHDSTILQIASLPDLYKIFERC